MEHSAEYAQIMEKMLADNAIAAEAVVAGAQTERLAAADALEEARQQLQETEQNAAQILLEYTERHHVLLEKEVLNEVKRDLAERFLYQNKSVTVVADLLEMEEDFVRELAKRQGRKKIAGVDTWLEYDEAGRSGYIIFHQENVSCRFMYEFGGGLVLVVIEVPAAEEWESDTGLPLLERKAILDFIGAGVVMHKARGHRHEIKDRAILIYL